MSFSDSAPGGCREALPGSGRQAVFWKTQSKTDGKVIMECGNSKLKQK